MWTVLTPPAAQLSQKSKLGGSEKYPFQCSTSVSAQAKLLYGIDLYFIQNLGKRVLLSLISDRGRSSLTHLYSLWGAMIFCQRYEGGCVRYAIANLINEISKNLRIAVDIPKRAVSSEVLGSACKWIVNIFGLYFLDWCKILINSWYQIMDKRY